MLGGRAVCRRKKDHGRAEALLIAAWSANMRQKPQTITSESGVEDTVQLPVQEESVGSAAEQCLTALVDACNGAAQKPLAVEHASEQHAAGMVDPSSSSRQSQTVAEAEADLDPAEFAAWKEAVKQQMIDSVAPSHRERVAAVLKVYQA